MAFDTPEIPLITPDTNVCVSGGTISSNPPGQIIQAWREGTVEFALCEPIFQEIIEVLDRPFFRDRIGWTQEKITEYVAQLREGSAVVAATTEVTVCDDPDDNMLFSCAVEAGAGYIVSGDAKVLEVGEYQGITVMRPREFVDQILSTQKQAA
jgi:uncharacterized protein